MFVPKEIADQVRGYRDQIEAARKNRKEAVEWLEKNTDQDYFAISEHVEMGCPIKIQVPMPVDVADKIRTYRNCWRKAAVIHVQVWDWLKANTRIGDAVVTNLFLTDTPIGTFQGEGEYHRTLEDEARERGGEVWGDDPDAGTHYHAVAGSEMYLGYSFENSYGAE